MIIYYYSNNIIEIKNCQPILFIGCFPYNYVQNKFRKISNSYHINYNHIIRDIKNAIKSFHT